MNLTLITLLEQSSNSSQEYFEGIYLDKYGNYKINRKGGEYIGYAKTLPEALHFRDMFRNTKKDHIPRPSELDLTINNPYLNGLKYPIPERLQHIHGKRGKGSIVKHSKNSYKITYNHKYYCSCRTYEQAYYVRQELIKHQWDKNKLPEILDNYPVWYTWLVEYYRYIVEDSSAKKMGKKRYQISIPSQYVTPGQKLEFIRGYTNLEDALFERDFLMEHNWDYNLLVEAIDDAENPYYNQELPPYPERKIRNIAQKTYKKEIQAMQREVLIDPNLSQRQMAKKLGTSDMNIRNWLKKYDTDWLKFKTLILQGHDPLKELTLKQKVYQPDLSPAPHTRFKGYIHYNPERKTSPYRVKYNKKDYGSYPTRELAKKIVRDLKKVDWDKKQLKEIQEKHGHYTRYNRRKGIYKDRHSSHYYIAKKINKKTVHFGTYPTLEQAEIARNLLEHNRWDKRTLPEIKELSQWISHVKKLPFIKRLESEIKS